MEKLIVTVAPAGAEVSRQDNPNLPLTPEEIAQAVCDSWREGASIAHLHVYDERSAPTQDPAVFARTIELIRNRCDIIIQVSTGGAIGMTAGQRLAPVFLKPEMASLTPGSINFAAGVFLNPPADVRAFAAAMKEAGVKPEVEVFDAGMIGAALALAREGLLAEPMHFDFVLGVPGGIAATPKNLLFLAESVPAGSTWTVAGVGRHQLAMSVMAILVGGHVRVGFEDNVYYSRGVLAASNAQFVGRVARLARELGREVASAAEARKILGIPFPPGGKKEESARGAANGISA